ncbi:adenylate/guanylate cyclase domain-containing protein [Bradyrhizobium sp. BWA-3-5]|uniref:adenylate/guanylate cyclase domain-containing protein n=1 Tax=Bradyrhizobium sp. BWA-3-5 TaxID=3080013 RepID=UPI00293F0973|nr:adenylate/guanylate cyclase domain-containing protein [Bradyrhizobium sp. BWA-3-5]WOH63139.1 adenylate/guanylate cyclase domain-containing protein [Bradyrhizobium sp. BWA-3-5]
MAVFAADVEGYSRLMGADEVGTLRGLTDRRAILDKAIAEHRGRIANTAGDSVLAEFGSAVDAVQCAVEAQAALAEENAGLSPDKRINFRIGIHVGDVMVRAGDLFGDGVNIAARLQALAQPGGVCVSGETYGQVRKVLPVAFTDLGAQQVKNIEEPVRAYTATGLSETVGLVTKRSTDIFKPLSLPDKPSIAVLPFQNMSGDPEQEYFADGMVEDIITALSRFKWLFVIARNSTFAYKGRSVDIRQVGRELGVRYVLEGSVRKATERVRITAQLIDAETSAHIWADRYDRAVDDIFALQDEITLSTVAAIEPSVRQAEIERAKRKRPENLDAYDLLLRATPLVDTGMPEGASQAVPLLERALLLEPNYALAHGQTAFCNEILYLRAGRREENRAAAIRHAHTAVALGPDDAPALVYAAIAIGLVEHNRALAQETFEAALAISPSAAWAYSWGALILGWGGEAEHAIDWGERGIRLSPLDPWITAALHGICMGHFLRGRYEDAAVAAQRAIRSKPGFSVSHMFLAAALAKLGRMEDAKVAADRVMQLQPNFSSTGQCSAIGCVPMLAGPLIEAMRASGLPE